MIEIDIIGTEPARRPLFPFRDGSPAKIKKPEAHTSGPRHAYRSSAFLRRRLAAPPVKPTTDCLFMARRYFS
jgi:hypothetical protein